MVAARVTAEGAGGRVPFDQLPLAGSPGVLRGYVAGRFRDAALASAQVEVRQGLPWRFGVVAWGGTGAVAPRLGALRADRLLPTAGVGVRWLLLSREGANLRVDYGVGRGGARGLYVGFGEAF